MIKKSCVYAIIGLLILFIGIFAINAVMDKTTKGWHDSDYILITVDGYKMTLQEAVDTNAFIDGATTDYTTLISGATHNANEIWVSTDSGEMTLLNALSDGIPLQKTSPTTSYSSAPSTLAYHFANEIEVTIDSSEMSLQDAIDEGELSCVLEYGQSCPSGDPLCINAGAIACDGTCTGSYKAQGISCGTGMECDGNGNCVEACASNYGDSCGGSVCIYPGTIACDGTCIGTSYKPKGTNCYSDTKACNGAGSCLGWSGTGCGSCPWGYSSSACNLNGNQGRYKSASGSWGSWSYSTRPRCNYVTTCWSIRGYYSCVKDYSWQIKP